MCFFVKFPDGKQLIAAAGTEKSEVIIYELSTLQPVTALLPSNQHKPLGMNVAIVFDCHTACSVKDIEADVFDFVTLHSSVALCADLSRGWGMGTLTLLISGPKICFKKKKLQKTSRIVSRKMTS